MRSKLAKDSGRRLPQAQKPTRVLQPETRSHVRKTCANSSFAQLSLDMQFINTARRWMHHQAIQDGSRISHPKGGAPSTEGSRCVHSADAATLIAMSNPTQ